MTKEFGKLTADQFQQFIQILPDVLTVLRDTDEHLACASTAKFDSVFPGDYRGYSHVYELPFVKLVSWVGGPDTPLQHTHESRTTACA